MRAKPILATAALGLTIAGSSAVAEGVRTLSTDEMVDTFIRDSAIVVSPRGNREARTIEESRARAIQAIVRPGEPIRSETEELQTATAMQNQRLDSLKEAQQVAEEQFIRDSLFLTSDQLASAQPQIQTALPTPPLFGVSRPEIPDAPFARNYFNDQLGLAYDGNTVDFKIGNNLPGVDQIDVPHAINEGPVQLQPRAGGGFDLSIAVPD
ncbi:hypothetical protein DES49_1654 [Halospina denitrificans]|uniref:Uncharacterized protein n=1 Tax=Halospina denitrificans TaxID=332522 RepID=A0A4V3EQE2_9GAMM|nr:hypothetical protein [Halospina denitrificans]TDT41558.1 hypothetical protein DES49_1654 [Halospina denitrificans]